MPRVFESICIAVALLGACYSSPEPDCGFVCGPAGECPSNYTCAADNVCHRNGTPASLVCGVDAAPRIDAALSDASGDAVGDAGTDAADTTAPMLMSSSPASGATGVSRSTTISVVFTEAVMNVSGTTFTLSTGGSPVAGTVSMTSATTYVLTPSAMLANNASFTVTLTSGITDVAGNALSPAPTTFTFDTN